jgi:hypothetical protein
VQRFDSLDAKRELFCNALIMPVKAVESKARRG